jgi:hypothetical protein
MTLFEVMNKFLRCAGVDVIYRPRYGVNCLLTLKRGSTKLHITGRYTSFNI